MQLNAIFLVIPIILIRFGLMGWLSKDALARAGYFPPLKGAEVTAYWVYQVTNLFLIFSLFFFRIRMASVWFWAGLALYTFGCLLYAASVIAYSRPRENGINQNGIYRLSRNPMYVAYFIYFFGCGLLIASWLYLLVLAVFQVSVHWLILSEERWCLQQFGADYERYMRTVNRYVGVTLGRSRTWYGSRQASSRQQR